MGEMGSIVQKNKPKLIIVQWKKYENQQKIFETLLLCR